MDFEGKWFDYIGKIKEKWGKLTDDDLAEIRGKKESLIGKIQSRYGYTKEKVEKELAEFCDKHKSCGCEHKSCGCKGPCNCGQKPRH
ncbi:MAG: CsbD family protein [Chlamydiales bacterium]|jgi:uncharacterized protein YjbJ (UPF0337 family)|nr:CsbD family protein [Chlamydiales bacterium]